jgi:hypothetical protein
MSLPGAPTPICHGATKAGVRAHSRHAGSDTTNADTGLSVTGLPPKQVVPRVRQPEARRGMTRAVGRPRRPAYLRLGHPFPQTMHKQPFMHPPPAPLHRLWQTSTSQSPALLCRAPSSATIPAAPPASSPFATRRRDMPVANCFVMPSNRWLSKTILLVCAVLAPARTCTEHAPRRSTAHA